MRDHRTRQSPLRDYLEDVEVGGVAGEDGPLRADAIQFREEDHLGLAVLHDGLHDEVGAPASFFDGPRRRDARDYLRDRIARDKTPLRERRQIRRR